MRIVVCTPYFGAIDREHDRCMRTLFATPVSRAEVVGVELPDCPWIDMAFAYLADRALEMSPDVVLFIEHDMLFKAEDAVGMCERLAESDYAVLGAGYSQRKAGGRMVGEPKNAETVMFYKPGLIDANSLGLGFTAIMPVVFHELREGMRDVYCPAVDKRVYPYFAHEISDMYIGQDTSFFRRVRQAGFRIGLDCEPRVFHKGAYRYALEDTGMTVPRYLDGLTMHIAPEVGEPPPDSLPRVLPTPAAGSAAE